MKKLVALFVLFLMFGLSAQESPKVIFEDSLQLRLKSLDVKVEIIGNFATTTYDMQFFNELDRTLEGSLAFPLGEGQAVSNFAMDVNGKLREAVVVEKELARVAFESTVRQNIDPGLLEKTEGNNYKARVYPILPKTNKHIVITYEQELFSSNAFHLYKLPLGISESLEDFSVTIDVLDANSLPKIASANYQNFFFKENKEGYMASLKLKNHSPGKPILVQLSNNGDANKVLTSSDYFYAYKKLTPKSRLKSKPKKITLFWDASYSLRNRNLDKELVLLEDYIGYLRNVDIQFVSFSNTILTNKLFSIKDGVWDALKNELEKVNYDGGTSFKSLNSLKAVGNEILLFTDGLANLGNIDKIKNTAIYTISSTTSSNFEFMNTLATLSGGSYVNLVRLPHVQALKKLKEEAFQFLGCNHDANVYDVYPKGIKNLTEDFSISGKFSNDAEIELLFGYGGKVTERLKIQIQTSEQSKLIKRLWAKQKLKFLNENKKENKDQIIALAKSYHLITDYTSMLILDRIEDYVQYRIEPPKELRAAYKELLSNREEEEANRLAAITRQKEGLFSGYQKLQDWYIETFRIKVKKPNDQGQINSRPQNLAATTLTDHIDATRRIVSGTIVDSEGKPIPAATILVKGTTNGTTSDFDGNFVINAEENDELVISYLGYLSKVHLLDSERSIRIPMVEDNSVLEEVVVLGYEVQRESSVLGYAIQEGRADTGYEMFNSEETMVLGLLNGKLNGVENDEVSNSSTSNMLQGLYRSHSENSPLYIIDGSIAVKDSIPNLTPKEISNIEVIKADAATALYGSRAGKGLIIITTKTGLETKPEAIAALNKKIADKIDLKSWDPNTPYLKILEKEATVVLAYKKYLEIRNEYANSPSFYLDVSDFFDQKGNSEIALTVLSNLIEIELNNHELMKALAYKLEYYEQYDLAVIVYQKVLELRPEEPQSYRDLALAYEKSGALKKSYDLLYQIYSGALLEKDMGGRFNGIEQIAFVELTRLVHKYEKELKLESAEQEKFNKMPVDVRVVIDWNHNDTDIDLWVTDPNKEKAFYENVKTKIGGRMSQDVTQGYGPEEFMLKKALEGEYKVVVNYFADTVQKISGPTFLKVTLFTNYAKENEVSKTIIVRLDTKKGEIEVGSLRF